MCTHDAPRNDAANIPSIALVRIRTQQRSAAVALRMGKWSRKHVGFATGHDDDNRQRKLANRLSCPWAIYKYRKTCLTCIVSPRLRFHDYGNDVSVKSEKWEEEKNWNFLNKFSFSCYMDEAPFATFRSNLEFHPASDLRAEGKGHKIDFVIGGKFNLVEWSR